MNRNLDVPSNPFPAGQSLPPGASAPAPGVKLPGMPAGKAAALAQLIAVLASQPKVNKNFLP